MAYNRTYYFNFISDQDLTYRVEIFDDVAVSNYQNKEGTLGPAAVSLNYGSDAPEMFASFKPSKMTLDFMVTDTNSGGYVNQLRTARNERDVYAYIYRETVVGSNTPTTSPVWGGFLLIDLSTDPDVSAPYNMQLTFVDGLASLKYYDFVPSTTTQSTDHLYDRGDTFISDVDNSGGQYDVFRTFIDIISECMGYLGHYTTSTGSPANPTITTAARWYNGKMANKTDDPLAKTRVKPDIYYEAETVAENDWPLEDEIKYKAKNCYDVLKSICKGWGMRLYLWKNTWYFIQINEFRKNQTGTFAAPDDISSHNYSMAGVTSGASDSISTEWGTYQLFLSSLGGSTVRNYKIAGGQYGILPALKKVIIDCLAIDNVNRFTSFPNIAPTTAPTGTFPQDHYSFSSLGVFTFDGTNDQDFYQRIVLNITNNSVYTVDLFMHWGLFARVAGTGTNTANTPPEDNGWTHMLWPGNPGSNPAMEWYGLSNWPQNSTQWPFTTDTPYCYPSWGEYIPDVAPGLTTVDIINYAGYVTSSGWRPYQYPHFPASVFTAGDWELCYYTKSTYYNANLPSYETHGYLNVQGANPINSTPQGLEVSYSNPPLGQGAYSSEFTPILDGAIGMESTTNVITQAGSDTEILDIGRVDFGDTGYLSSVGTLQVYNGSAWVVSDLAGDWGIDTLTGTNSFSQQLGLDILATQGKSLKTFNVSTTTNPAESIYDTDASATIPRFANPGTKWRTIAHYPSGTPAADWIMHTGEWFPKADTWNWKLYQQEAFSVTTTGTTVGNFGSNTGMIGGPNIAVPVGGPSALIGPPGGQNLGAVGQALSKGLSTQLKPIAIIDANQSISMTGSTTLSQTITSLSVIEMPVAILKAGDTIVVQTQTTGPANLGAAEPLEDTLGLHTPITFEVASDQAAGATSISVTSQVIHRNISIGDLISFDTQDLIAQYQNKTKGTIAGLPVTATTFDGAASVGRNIMSFRIEGNDLDDGDYYVFNGEDQTRSNRFQPTNTSAPTSIGTQRSFKSMCFIADSYYSIESGKMVVSGTSGWSIAIQLYKATPVDGSTAVQAMTLLGTYNVTLAGNSQTKTANLTSLSTDPIVAGDMIIPHCYAAASGGTTFDFRGGITFTLVRAEEPS